jgi:hypothetical protein
LFDLPVQVADQDVTIRKKRIQLGPVEGDVPYPYIKLTLQEAVFTLEGVGRFRVSDGCRIDVDPDSDADPAQLQGYLLGNALAVLLYQRKRLLLHASVVSINRRGVAFLGDSGAGKSSIAAAFLAKGYKLLVDDLASIDVVENSAWVDPGFPYIKLSNDALGLFASNPAQLVFMEEIDEKKSYLIEELSNGNRVALEQIFVIKSGEEVVLEPFNAQQALLELMRYSIPPSMVRLNHAAHFERCVELVKCTRVFGLRRPGSISQLSQLVDRVEMSISH